MDKALLIGNGVNRVNGEALDWKGLLIKLANFAGPGLVPTLDDFKPLPLFLEEIALVKDDNYKDTIREIKTVVRELMSAIEPNQIHKDILHSNVTDIMTTNYDFGFEKFFDNSYMNFKPNSEQTKETKHSLKRKKVLSNGKTLWHIHGEIYNPKGLREGKKEYPEMSIMIGYEHYSDYLKKIQEYTIEIGRRPANENQQFTSWVDIFLKQNIIVCGIDLSFFEHHLWWLLNYRAIQIKNNPHKPAFFNTITYVYPEFPQPELSDKTHDDLNKSKQKRACLDLMQAMKVDTVPIAVNTNDYGQFYEIVIDKYLN